MLILFFIVAAESGFSRNVSWMSLASSTLNWLSFTVAGQTDINALPGTKLIIAGVTWSLPYEWMLYATLPLMAVGLRRAVPIWTVAAALLALAVLITAGHPGIGNSVVFLGGIIAAVFVRMPRWRMLAQGRIAGGVAALSILLAYTAFSKVHGPALVPLTIAFTIIASGNTLFGVLANPVSRLLGELSYSLYLLHGLLLFIIFRWVLPIDQAAGLTPVAHWAVVAALAPVLVLVSFITFHTIESPAMGAVSRVTTLLRTGRFRRPAVIPPI
jgi:peptidoglycan/LPS O-acetylase OafA/YrhL